MRPRRSAGPASGGRRTRLLLFALLAAGASLGWLSYSVGWRSGASSGVPLAGLPGEQPAQQRLDFQALAQQVRLWRLCCTPHHATA